VLRERVVQIKSAVEPCEPAPGIGFSIELDHVNRTDGSNNMKAAFPVSIRVDGEGGWKKTISGPGMHLVSGGFRRLDILDGPVGAYYRVTVAEVAGDAMDVVREPPKFYGDPPLLGMQGLGPTPVTMLAGRMASEDDVRGQASVLMANERGVLLLGFTDGGQPTALRTDTDGKLITVPELNTPSTDPVVLVEFRNTSPTYDDLIFSNNKSAYFDSLYTWSHDPNTDGTDVSQFTGGLQVEISGGVTDLDAGQLLKLVPFIELMPAQASDSGATVEPFAKVELTGGPTFQETSHAGGLQVGPGLQTSSGAGFASLAARPRLARFGFRVTNAPSGAQAGGAFRFRVVGFY
jgi:hypothetical protein